MITAPHADITPAAQKELPGMAEVRAEFGLMELPVGAAELTAKELQFVLNYIRTGRMRDSAVAAGYSERAAAQTASETLRKPHVAGFYRRLCESMGAETRAAVGRVAARSRVLHERAMEGLDQSSISVGAKTQEAAKLALDHDRALLALAGTKLELSGKVDGDGLSPKLMAALTKLREEGIRDA